jgi:NAD(P)-dependent dehydrogenase (short-subunit alcohol dehydrogenase family)
MTPTAPGTTRTALVTGAAHGIGRAVTQALLARGWRVGAFDVDEAALEQIERTASEQGREVVTGRLDVRIPEDWERAVKLLCDGGRLDLLVNNAGILSAGPFDTIPLERHRAIVDTNVTGVINGAHICLPHLKASPAGLMINMCSASAIHGQPELATYSATKFAVRGLTEALELEWAHHGVTVRDLWPLFVSTGMVDGVSTSTTRSLGIRLDEHDVATALLRLLDQHLARTLTRRKGQTGSAVRVRAPWVASVHRPVGMQTRLMTAAAQVSPHWLNRLMTKTLSRS